MFRAIVMTQWKWTRTALLLATLAGFSLPLAALQSAREAYTPVEFIARMQSWGIGFAVLSAMVGLLVALAAWGHDHQGRHVYALSLPITRSRYVLLRFGAGSLFLLGPIVAVLIGCLIVSVSGAIPTGLHAFPLALTLRFAFATAVAYALFFAIGAATTRTAAIVLGVIAVVFLAQFFLGAIGFEYDLLGRLAEFVFVRPGILSVFSGRWMLVDV
jgi:hypothetical protein